MFRAICAMLVVMFLVFSPSVSTPKAGSTKQDQEREKAVRRLREIQAEGKGVEKALQSLFREAERWDKIRALEERHDKSTTPEEEDQILRELDKIWEKVPAPKAKEDNKPEQEPKPIVQQQEGLFA